MSLDLAASPASAGAGADMRTRLVIAALIAAAGVMHLSWSLPADTSWLLTVCERMLSGQKLYADIIELNPPMSAWLYLPWVWLAGKSGASPEVAIVCAVLAVCVAMIALSGRILTKAGLLRDDRTWRLVATLALVVAPVVTFSQREHFAVAFALPMLAALAARAAGRPLPLWTMLAAGLCGGLTMAVKPHFAFAIALPALYAVFARRSLKPAFAPECLTAAVTLIAYVATFWSVHPEYFRDLLPIVTDVYLPNVNPLIQVLTQPYIVLVYICVYAWLKRPGFRDDVLSRVLLAAVAGFFVAYMLPGRGWIYHSLPVATLSMIGFGLSLRRVSGAERRPTAPTLSKIAIAVVSLTTIHSAVERVMIDERFVRELARTFASLPPHPKIAMLADDLAVGSPVHRSVGGTLVNSGPSLWMAANAISLCRNETKPERKATCDAAIARERALLAEDLRRDPPDVILTNTTGYDWLGWASEDASLASLIARFHPIATIEYGTLKARVLVADPTAGAKLRQSIHDGRPL